VSKLNHKNTPKKIDISKKGVNYSSGGHHWDSPGRHLGGHPIEIRVLVEKGLI
jgi:hypothetical protein